MVGPFCSRGVGCAHCAVITDYSCTRTGSVLLRPCIIDTLGVQLGTFLKGARGHDDAVPIKVYTTGSGSACGGEGGPAVALPPARLHRLWRQSIVSDTRKRRIHSGRAGGFGDRGSSSSSSDSFDSASDFGFDSGCELTYLVRQTCSPSSPLTPDHHGSLSARISLQARHKKGLTQPL